MSVFLLFAAGLVFAGVLSFGLVRSGRDRGGYEWALGWWTLFITGAVGALSAELASAFAHLGFVLFSGLLYLGARRFSGLARRPGDVAVIGGGALATIPLALFGPWWAAPLVSVPAALFAPFLASREIFRAKERRPSERYDRLLAFSLYLPAAAGLLSVPFPEANVPSDLYFVWFIMLIAVSGMQVGALMNQIAVRSEMRRTALVALVEAVPVGLAISRESGELALANPTLVDLLGFAPNHVPLGRPFERLFDRLEARCETGDGEAVRGLRDNRGASARLRLDDGRVLDAQIVPVRSREGRPTGRVLVLRDITEERRMEEHLQRSRQLETLGGLAGGVAHDFNNKLTSILGNAVLISEDLEPDSPLQGDLADLQHAAEYCSSLTRDLLDFARATPRLPSPVEVQPLVEQVAREMRSEIPPGVSLRVEVDESAGFVMADASQIERVLTNLIANARDAVADDGEILVTACAAKDDPEMVEIAVGDDGAGIDEETRARIFDPFFTTKPTGSGTGLGLAIVFGIVKAHGGDVRVDARPSGGTLFCTEWPRAEAKAAVAVRARIESAEKRDLGSLGVLVVDDEEPIRRLVGRALEKEGYRVTLAPDGREALRHFREQGDAIDLAIVDLSMPGMDGDEVLRVMWQERPGMPAIMISGRLPDERLATLPPELQKLPKPFRPRDLLRAVERAGGLLGERRALVDAPIQGDDAEAM